MAELKLFVVAESVSIDQTTNSASVFNILEEVHAVQFPILVPSCAVLSVWHREAGDEGKDWQLVLRVTPPNGDSHDLSSNFRFANPRHRVVQRVLGLAVEHAGQLDFELQLNGRRVAEYTVGVRQAAASDVVGESASARG